jgi:predicted alpha/beta-hydrolase family hydrolase
MAQACSIPRSTGGEISARRYDAADPAATFVLAHGAGAGQGHPFLVRTATDLAARGIAVITFNFPYMDRGRGAPDPAPVLEACYLDVIGFVRGSTPVGALFIGGKSMGGRIATQVAARAEAVVDGVIVLGYPLHPPGKPDTLRVKHLAAVRAPMLILQGTRDAFGSPVELRRHFPATTVIDSVDGGDHSFALTGSKRAAQADVYRSLAETIVNWIHSVSTGTRR